MRGALLILRLAIADLTHDRLVSLCQIIMAAAVIAPLLLLFALKHGVATTLLEELRANPETLRIRPVGSYRLGPDFFRDMAARPETGFLVPATRAIATQIYLAKAKGRAPLADIQMLPTAPGDPLGQGSPLIAAARQVALSTPAARQLDALPGDRLRGIVERSRDGRVEPATVELIVSRVVPEALYLSATAFVHPDLIEAAERYRDGYEVPAFGWPGERAWEPIAEYASFRLYASDLSDVAPLAEAVRAAGIETRTDADRIAGILALDRNLNALFLIVGSVAAAGLVGALLASMVAGVERKRRALAVLGLLGFRRGLLAAFPMAQAGMVALAGYGLSLAVYGAGAIAVQSYFAPLLQDGQAAISLEPWHFAAAGLATLALALPSALATGFRAAATEPSEALREV
ncbi:MAG: lipoprotein ABC transporter permease [Alphaproteobacteria bacterium]|nr:lipoprotein ABC transporter permease [Alphaproteobacteria bacterium]MBU0797752.1 lipoprotein ABC transporter permease [Alphaproteobacteria bacterium]MBU0886983.1 lipoprotein ABC transporter permease [Alphaproteobacteria bacterium]MBU1813161.1 lipoprotein ABC transporter permease [Alphaproteobacteria bacterium]